MNIRIVIDPKWEYLNDFIHSIPITFDASGVVIYDERNKIRLFDTPAGSVVVKSYAVPHLVNRIVYGNFRKSKARRAYEYGKEIIACGFDTPEPVAYIETVHGALFGRSYFVSLPSRYSRDFREISDFPPTPQTERILVDFARFTARLHDNRILHEDYTPGNIRFGAGEGNPGFGFELIDTNRMKFCDVSMETACRNMADLYIIDEQYRLLARSYAEARGFDADECEKLLLRVRVPKTEGWFIEQ